MFKRFRKKAKKEAFMITTPDGVTQMVDKPVYDYIRSLEKQLAIERARQRIRLRDNNKEGTT